MIQMLNILMSMISSENKNIILSFLYLIFDFDCRLFPSLSLFSLFRPGGKFAPKKESSNKNSDSIVQEEEQKKKAFLPQQDELSKASTILSQSQVRLLSPLVSLLFVLFFLLSLLFLLLLFFSLRH
jgi:hypothetical protein